MSPATFQSTLVGLEMSASTGLQAQCVVANINEEYKIVIYMNVYDKKIYLLVMNLSSYNELKCLAIYSMQNQTNH